MCKRWSKSKCIFEMTYFIPNLFKMPIVCYQNNGMATDSMLSFHFHWARSHSFRPILGSCIWFRSFLICWLRWVRAVKTNVCRIVMWYICVITVIIAAMDSYALNSELLHQWSNLAWYYGGGGSGSGGGAVKASGHDAGMHHVPCTA